MSGPSSSSSSSGVDPKTRVLRVGGVPEHFNMPWFLAEEQKLYAEHGVTLQWIEYKLGTGQMISALLAGECDVIVALTEGLVAQIALNSPLKLIGTYVESPLCWAISSGPNNEKVHEVADLKGGKIGISRFTSGSHLMSCVLASQRGWNQSDLTYVVEGSFENLRKSVASNATDAFMWETFTSKPYHDSGETKRIGEIVTPWPCFMLAARNDTLEDADKRSIIADTLKAIQESCRRFHAPSNTHDLAPIQSEEVLVKEISHRYGLKEQDAKAWYEGVHISASQTIVESTLDQTVAALKSAGILTAQNYSVDKPLKDFIDTGFVTLKPDIKGMKLYHKPELVTALWNNIRLVLKKEKGKLSVEELYPFDQNHYGGIGALQEALKFMPNLKEGSKMIQVGASVGGPSRFFHSATKCEVLAVELQEDLHGAARELTHRCGLDDKVHHMSGNFLQVANHLAEEKYDVISSWLTILHFTHQERLQFFQLCKKLLKSSHNQQQEAGLVYLEDFFEISPLTKEEKQILTQDVYCNYISSLSQYRSDIEHCGFQIVALEDLTSVWKQSVHDRREKLAQIRGQQVAIHGEEIVRSLEYFYGKIDLLFQGGHCGGVRIVAKKK